MKDIGKQLNEILSSLCRIAELDEKIDRLKARLAKKWMVYGG